MTKEEYQALDAVSNSRLSWVLPESGGSPKKYESNKLFPPDDLDSAAVELGTCAHILLETKTLDSFEVVSKPGPSVSAICEEVVNHPSYPSMTPVQINDEIVRVARARDFQPRWGDDAILKNILKDGTDYMEKLSTSTKKLVDHETMESLKCIEASLEETAPWIFSESKPESADPTDEIEWFREKAISFIHDEVTCKSLIDLMVVNHTKKLIDIYDLKTISMPVSLYLGYTMDGEEVPGRFMDRGVHRQLAFYSMAASSLYKDYAIALHIIACETKGIYESQIYTLNPTDVHKGLSRMNYGIDLLKRHDLISIGGL